jgi:DNA repair protein RadC
VRGATARRGEPISSSAVAYDRLRRYLDERGGEIFVVLALDARNRFVSVTQVAQGSVTAVEVHPREVFVPLIRDWAAAGIIAHNHPSGDPEPSHEDRLLTERLIAASKIIGVPLLDHLVIGRERYVSFADRGWMQGV